MTRRMPKLMTLMIPIPPGAIEENVRDIARIRAAHAPRELTDDEIIEIQFRETLGKMTKAAGAFMGRRK